jgi:F0F1-type ATP synthase membrane subunit b/b'
VSNRWILVIIGVLVVAALAIIWYALAPKKKPTKHTVKGTYEDQAKSDVEHIFNDEFREELRNRGRLYFEKIINENAMFLQQDLQATTSQLNDYIKREITQKLQEEFVKYEQTIRDANQIALRSIDKTNTTLETESQVLSDQLKTEFSNEKARLVKRFEENMAEIVNYYIVSAIGSQVDLNDQLSFIISDLQANKDEIVKDINNGA